MPIAKMYAVLLHSRRTRKKRNNILVSRPRLAKSARPRDEWSLIAKEPIDREGPFKETCILAVVFANCTCRYKFFPLVSKITPFLLP